MGVIVQYLKSPAQITGQSNTHSRLRALDILSEGIAKQGVVVGE
jgi:hypothetical protein